MYGTVYQGIALAVCSVSSATCWHIQSPIWIMKNTSVHWLVVHDTGAHHTRTAGEHSSGHLILGRERGKKWRELTVWQMDRAKLAFHNITNTSRHCYIIFSRIRENGDLWRCKYLFTRTPISRLVAPDILGIFTSNSEKSFTHSG